MSALNSQKLLLVSFWAHCPWMVLTSAGKEELKWQGHVGFWGHHAPSDTISIKRGLHDSWWTVWDLILISRAWLSMLHKDLYAASHQHSGDGILPAGSTNLALLKLVSSFLALRRKRSQAVRISVEEPSLFPVPRPSVHRALALFMDIHSSAFILDSFLPSRLIFFIPR